MRPLKRATHVICAIAKRPGVLDCAAAVVRSLWGDGLRVATTPGVTCDVAPGELTLWPLRGEKFQTICNAAAIVVEGRAESCQKLGISQLLGIRRGNIRRGPVVVRVIRHA